MWKFNLLTTKISYKLYCSRVCYMGGALGRSLSGTVYSELLKKKQWKFVARESWEFFIESLSKGKPQKSCIQMFQLYVQYISVMHNWFQSFLKNFGFCYHSFLPYFNCKYAHIQKIITELKPFHIVRQNC